MMAVRSPPQPWTGAGAGSRAQAATKTLPILMVTTRSVREDIVQAAQAGVNNYVVKPFTPQVLKEKIDQVLGAGVV